MNFRFLLSAKDIEQKILNGGYLSYSAACKGISKLKAVPDDEKVRLKAIAKEHFLPRHPASQTPSTSGLEAKEPDSLVEPPSDVLPILDEVVRPSYSSLKELRDALAEKVRELDEEIRLHEREIEMERAAEAISDLCRTAQALAVHEWIGGPPLPRGLCGLTKVEAARLVVQLVRHGYSEPGIELDLPREESSESGSKSEAEEPSSG